MRKAVTLALALMLALGLCTPAFAALPKMGSWDVDYLGADMDDLTPMLSGWSYLWQTDRDGNPRDAFWETNGPSDLLIYAGDKLYISLDSDLFLDKDGELYTSDGLPKNGANYMYLRTSQLSKLRLSLNKGKIAPWIKSVSLEYEHLESDSDNYKTACAVITFADDFIFVAEKDFDITLNLKIGGITGKVPLSGKLTFDQETVEEKQDSAESAGGIVLEPQATIMRLPIEIGESLTMTTNVIKDRKLYANAKVEWEKGIDPMFEELPDLLWVYQVNTFNVLTGQTTLKINIDDPQAFVYDKDGNYLGTTKDALPLSSRYFLCETQRESIVPPITDASAGSDPLQMTLAEYLVYLETGALPQRLLTPAQEETPAEDVADQAATA